MNILRRNKNVLGKSALAEVKFFVNPFLAKRRFLSLPNKFTSEQKVIKNNSNFQPSFFYLRKAHFGDKLPKHRKITMPNLSPTMSKGNIVEWTKKEGDEVQAGDTIASVETDKAQVDFELNEEGYLAKIIYPEGSQDVDVGTVVAIMVDEKEDIDAFKDYKSEDKQEKPQDEDKQEKPQDEDKQEEPTKEERPEKEEETKGDQGEIFRASPAAKSAAKDKGIDITKLKGTGPKGRVVLEDIMNKKEEKGEPEKIKSKKEAKTEPQEYEDIEISNVRKVIAQRLLESKTTIPHYYLTVECQVDNMMKTRSQLNEQAPVKISVNDLIIKAASLACMKVPEANSSWQDKYIRKYSVVDMSVAVSTDFGLITPIIKSSHSKGLVQISKEMRELSEKAKANKLKPQEFQGGTFTISNLGMMGISNFSAIINPPQACILAVGKSEKKLVYDEKPAESDKPYKLIQVMNCTLSCDHRVVDGAVGSRWIAEFKKLIENPELMLL